MTRIPSHKLAAIISEHAERHGGRENLSRMTGIEPRSLYRVQTGEHKFVTLDLADRYLTAMDEPWRLNEIAPVGEPTPERPGYDSCSNCGRRCLRGRGMCCLCVRFFARPGARAA